MKGENHMYERKNGSKRLATALQQAMDDEYVLSRLAQHLNYRPRQLREDIQAMYDVIQEKFSENQKDSL